MSDRGKFARTRSLAIAIAFAMAGTAVSAMLAPTVQAAMPPDAVPLPQSVLQKSRSLVAGDSLAPPQACDPACWQPSLRMSWQWKLNDPPTAKQISNNDIDFWDVDGFETTKAKVTGLQARSHVACYVSAGSYEGWRPDAEHFPGSARLSKSTPKHATRGILGWKMSGWNERWLDIRGINKPGNALAEIMTARIAMCRAKGFDAVEFDNVEGYTNKTGFPLTGKHQLRFNIWLANQAHSQGLSAILKNDVAQIPKLLPYFDAALNEQCWQYRECTTKQTGRYGYDQFVKAGKAVFGVEYQGRRGAFCPKANTENFNWLKKKLALGNYRVACRS